MVFWGFLIAGFDQMHFHQPLSQLLKYADEAIELF
jgi:hypothetical protein